MTNPGKGFKEQQGKYILDEFEEYSLNGNAYINKGYLHQLCRSTDKQLPAAKFLEDYDFLLDEGLLVVEEGDVYMKQTLRYENYSAAQLASLLNDIQVPVRALPPSMEGNGKQLTIEQRNAVEMALGNRLSIVLGGAGTGKTTLIEALVKYGASRSDDWSLCAPTGKAARNLTDRSGLDAKTLHGALRKLPGEDFLSVYELDGVRLIVVDEASMLTLEMLAGLLSAANSYCRIVLVGDPNQLLSVGAGNVLPDLLELGIPRALLSICHRQAGTNGALLDNVQHFGKIKSLADMRFDETFMMQEQYLLKDVSDQVCNTAAELYLRGESVQVLSPYNESTKLSVYHLNKRIQDIVNPLLPGSNTQNKQLCQFRNGDRVMVGKNDNNRGICNGDIGIIHIESDDPESPVFRISLPGGRSVSWNHMYGLNGLKLAYAITVHKSQGSEYATVIMPLIEPFSQTIDRNLIYTAISRAKRNVLLIGSVNVLDKAIQTASMKRLSKLVEKTNLNLSIKAAEANAQISKAS